MACLECLTTKVASVGNLISKIPHLTCFVLLMSSFCVLPKAIHAESESERKIDVLFLFDDTVSFEPYIEDFSGLAQSLIEELENSLPGVEFGFGIARFEDYGGPGWSFCSGPRTCLEDKQNRINGRPFILNQAIVTKEAAGGVAERNQLIGEALQRTAPGFGGDDPESALADALYQAATGVGFDGNGDAEFLGFSGIQRAGDIDTQVDPDESGDVPPFSSLIETHHTAGTEGGVGFRAEALKLIVLATDICSTVAIPPFSAVPDQIVGLYSSEYTDDFRCSSHPFGQDRSGYVSDAFSELSSTVPNSVVPKGGADIQLTIDALNAEKIRVIGMGPGVSPVPSGSGPSFEPGHFLSALARITGAVDSMGIPLVFDLEDEPYNVREKLVDNILLATASENPGCQTINFQNTLADTQTLIRRQKKTLNRLIRILKLSGAITTSYARPMRKKINVITEEALLTLSTLPQAPLICATTACPSISHQSELATIRSISTALKRRARRLSRSYRDKVSSTIRQRIIRKRKRARKLFQKVQEQISYLPQLSSLCSSNT